MLQAVILTPSSAALATGATQQFSVSGQWSNGATTAPAVTYSATGGTVTSGGLYTAGSTAGAFRVIATQQGGTLADTSSVTVSIPGSGPYANRPVNYTTTLSDYAFRDLPLVDNDSPLGGGWSVYNNQNATVSRVSDATAPQSPSEVLQWHFPTGHPSGTNVGNVYRSAPANASEFYVAFSMWHDANFEWNSISNKLFYLEPGNIILQSRHSMAGGQKYLSVYIGGTGKDYAPTNNIPIPLGQWVNYEFIVKRGNSGVLKVWMNGTLVLDYANIAVPTTTSGQELKLDTTWGGSTGPTTRDSYRRIDHIVVAIP